MIIDRNEKEGGGGTEDGHIKYIL